MTGVNIYVCVNIELKLIINSIKKITFTTFVFFFFVWKNDIHCTFLKQKGEKKAWHHGHIFSYTNFCDVILQLDSWNEF